MKKIAICLNMLSPYWMPVFNELGKLWNVKIFIATHLEPNREYDKKNIKTIGYNFEVIQNKNIMIDLRRYHFKTEFLNLQMGLWKDLIKHKPDVIISNELGVRTMIALVYGIIFRIPVIPWVCASKHTERNISIFRKQWRRILISNVKFVLTNLSLANEYLLDEYKLNKTQIYNTPYTLDVHEYSERVSRYKDQINIIKDELNLKGKIFLYVGQMIKRKGLQQLEKYVWTLTDIKEDFFFLFVGGVLPSSVKNTFIELGIRHVNINFVQPCDLPKYYSIADVFIFPSLEDEWGIVLNEAAASCLPLLSSIHAAATWDLVEDGVNGFRFDPLDINDFRAKFMRLVNMDKKTLLEMGNSSKMLVQKCDIGYTTKNFISCIQKALL